jgi:hypothetical protein
VTRGPWTALALLSALVAGCAAPAPDYAPPAGATAQTAAEIVGSTEPNPDRMTGDLVASVYGIDGVHVSSPGKPILVAPGAHTISIGVTRKHVFFGSQERAAAFDRRAEFRAGHRYVVRARMMGDEHALTWIEDGADAQPVGNQELVEMKKTFVPEVVVIPIVR